MTGRAVLTAPVGRGPGDVEPAVSGAARERAPHKTGASARAAVIGDFLVRRRGPMVDHKDGRRLRAIPHGWNVSNLPGGDIGRYLAIRQPNSTTAAPTTAAITDITIPPPSASSMAT
jgi:hypothetical protein